MSIRAQRQELRPPLEVKPLKWGRFRLTLLFAFTAIVSITIFSTLVVNRLALEIASDSVVSSTEEKIAEELRRLGTEHGLAYQGSQLVVQNSADPSVLLQRYFQEPQNVIRVNLLDPHGTVSWSTLAASQGDDQPISGIPETALGGSTVSRVDRNKRLTLSDGEVFTGDIVATYVPLRTGQSEEVLGVLEVYSDVSGQLSASVDATKATIRWTTFLTMGGLFLILLGFIIAADLSNQRSNQSQMLLAAEAQRLVQDQLQQQVEDNLRLQTEIARRQEAEEEQRKLAEEREIVADIGRIVTSTLNIDEVYEGFASEVKKLVDFDRIIISVADRDAGTYTVKYAFGGDSSQISNYGTQDLEGSQTQRVISTGQTLIRADTCQYPEFASDYIHAKYGRRSSIAVPLFAKGQAMGIMSLRSQRADVYGSREQAILEGLANQIAPALANAQMYERTRQIREEVHRLSQAIANMEDGLLMVDLEGRIFFANPAAERMYGFGPGELKGVEIWSLRSEENVVTGRQIFESVKAGGWTGELIAKRKDGSKFPIRLSSVPVLDEEGHQVCTMGLNTDITESKETEQRMRESARLASIGELAAGVAHEINNPLTSILGFTRLSLQEELPPRAYEDLEKICSEATRAGKIVHNLLSFARKHEPEQQLLSVTSVVERALELKSYDLKNGNIDIIRELSPDIPDTMFDEHQLIQVVMNVITNAEQAIKQTSGRGRITVRISHTADRIRLSFSDNGPGIKPEILSRVFEPFFTTKEIGVGTGLGLSICYGIVQQHGGDIWAESTPGSGATFHIELPIAGPSEGVREPQPTQHLLVVDDEPSIRDLLARTLIKERYTVDLAENGKEAWRKLRVNSYDCIIMDLKMPEMSGSELFWQLERIDPNLARRVLFITGDLISAETMDFIEAAGNLTLTKPFDLDLLHSTLRTILDFTVPQKEPTHA